MNSLWYFLITIVLLIVGSLLALNDYFISGLVISGIAMIIFLIGAVINHLEHTRRR